VLDHFATVTNRVASANHFTPPGRSLEGTCGVLSGLHLLPNPEMSHAGEIRAAQRFALLSLLTASLQCCGAAASRRRRLYVVKTCCEKSGLRADRAARSSPDLYKAVP
jgi:hypothetical protein